MTLTPVIISFNSIKILDDCIKNFGKKINLIIVENSNNKELKCRIESKYKKAKVILNKSNYGYGKAANIGFGYVKTKYAYLINPDIELNLKQIKILNNKVSKLGDNFTLATPIYSDLIDFYKTTNFYKYFSNVITKNTKDLLYKNFLKGSSIIINLKKFNNKKIFDENFFYFFEELDLCKRVINKNQKIVVFKKIKIKHRNSQSVDLNKDKYSNFRNWNYYWSSFYFCKKHFGIFFSFKKHSFKLIRFLFSFFFFMFFSKEKFYASKFRLLGLLSSIFGIRSSISKKIIS